MTRHRIHVELSTIDFLLDLPEGVTVQGAQVEGENLILVVDSEKDLGSADLTTLYGLSEETEAFILGLLEPKKSNAR
jgi:hypothetical protein